MNDAIAASLADCEPGVHLRNALQKLLERDAYLLTVDANERSIAARLAMYLQAEYTDWHVDCEYNRDGIDPKRLAFSGLDSTIEDAEARTVFPDIVVHVRGTSNNYLVLELKKSSNTVERAFDLAKLSRYRRQLNYSYAVFIELLVGAVPDVREVRWINS